MADDPVEKRTLQQAVGEMTVLWNHCQAMVFSIFFHSLGADLPKAQSVFFSIPSDRGQRNAARKLLQSSPSDFATRADDAIHDLGELGDLRNAFIHAIWDFSRQSADATSWLGVWNKRLGAGDPIVKCAGLIADLNGLLGRLTALEQESRTNPPPAQGSLALTLPALPAQQVVGQAATTASPALQQPDSQSLQQSSQSRDP